MPHPAILPTSSSAETFAGFTYHLDGELVPALTIELKPEQSVYFEHYTLFWKDIAVAVRIRKMKGVFKRFMAGMQIFMTEATGNGSISLSRDGVGHIFAKHLDHGEELDVREHQFLAATGNLDFTFQLMKGVSNILFGGNSFFIDKFVANSGPGILWLHGYGNVFEVNLAAGEQIDVEPGAWLYKDRTVALTTNLTNLSTAIFGSSSITLNRFTGPGRIGLQSMSQPMMHAGGPGGTGNNARMAKGLSLTAIIMGLLVGRS